jgi:hypothetical protein
MKGYIVTYSDYDEHEDTGEVFLSKEKALKRLGAKVQELTEEYKPITEEQYNEQHDEGDWTLKKWNEVRADLLKHSIDNWDISEYEVIE